MERKKKPSPGRALAKLGYIRRKGEAAAERVQDNVSLDTDRYNNPEEYAENELFEIANDSIEAGRETGRKAKERIKHRMLNYTVESIRILDSDEELRIPLISGQHLMLTTCYPFYYTGHAPQKFVLIATISI